MAWFLLAKLLTKYFFTVPLNKFFKQELSGGMGYEHTSVKEKSVINAHICHRATILAVSVDEDQEY